MDDWDAIKEIKEEVENNGNVLTVTMERLRNAHGSAKLGVHVRTEISSQLAGLGLGHVPKSLPTYYHEQVRLYKRGTPVGDLIETVLASGEQNDKKLVDELGESDVNYAAVIEQIRELVSE